MAEIRAAVRAVLTDRIFLAVAVLAVGCAALLLSIQGMGAVTRALIDDVRIFTVLVIFVPPVLLLSAYVEVVLPKRVVEQWLGTKSGLKGIMVASAAGALTPGGPYMTYPLVAALYRAGADFGPLVAYVTGWSLLGVFRILVFEIPLVGPELPMVRFIACLPLPIVAGVLAVRIARAFRIRREDDLEC
jgi:uncharacterized membrane protein YraQ (UPF0718 family)